MDPKADNTRSRLSGFAKISEITAEKDNDLPLKTHLRYLYRVLTEPCAKQDRN